MAHAQLELGDVAQAVTNAEQAVAITARDDWATVASTRMVLGLVREAQGRLDEAETLLREAYDTVARVDFNPWEELLALAEFLLRGGRLDEGRARMAQAREAAARLSPESPIVRYVDRRAARAGVAPEID